MIWRRSGEQPCRNRTKWLERARHEDSPVKITIAAVGRIKAGPEKVLWDQYARRLTWPLALKEVEERNPLKPAKLKQKEAELLLSAVPSGACIVALDKAGKAYSSRNLAAQFDRWMNDGPSDIAFVIGGAEGLDKSILDQAALKLAMGAMTWPHMLARVMLIEQTYRAQCILGNHPYHK